MTVRQSTGDHPAAGLNDDNAWLLYHGIKSLLRCDDAEVVSGIARYVMSQHESLRKGSEWVERRRGTDAPAVVALLGGMTRFLEVRPGRRRDGAVWMARLSNERRAVEMLPALVPELDWSQWTFHRIPNAPGLAQLARSFLPKRRRILGIARRLHQHYEFFKVLRVIELVGYYLRYVEIFRSGRFCVAAMSSHSNPHGIAFNLAARKCGVPVVLITHGMPVRPVAKLAYDLAVVHCEAARRTYAEEGCRIGRVLIHGRRQDYAPMPSVSLTELLTIGVFLCKDVNEAKLRVVVERLLANARVSGVLIRPHPKNLWVGLDAWIAGQNDLRLCKSSKSSVFSDIEASDIVLGGNSSVLVDAVTAGHPSGYVKGIDYGSRDLHRFVAQGLVYPIDDALTFNFDEIVNFYRHPNWLTVLRLFANIDQDEASVSTELSAAIRELAQSCSTTPMPRTRKEADHARGTALSP